jgi:hypothetical protein
LGFSVLLILILCCQRRPNLLKRSVFFCCRTYLYRDVEYRPPTPTTARWKKKQVCKTEQIYTLLKLKLPSFYMVI